MSRPAENTKTKFDASAKLVGQIKPILAGNNVEIVGAALVQLVAIFLAGHSPGLREEARRLFIQCFDQLTAVEVEELIAAERVPPHWRITPRPQ
jgi:hypothetical protein